MVKVLWKDGTGVMIFFNSHMYINGSKKGNKKLIHKHRNKRNAKKQLIAPQTTAAEKRFEKQREEKNSLPRRRTAYILKII